MDNRNRPNDHHLGVIKVGKNIKKSPLHQPNFANNPPRQQPQPQVYNISKNDFRNIVQQLTGSPAHDPLPRPPQNPPKPQSMRLQRIRPPPLAPINRPHIPAQVAVPAPAPPPMPAPAQRPMPGQVSAQRPMPGQVPAQRPMPGQVPAPAAYNSNVPRPAQFGHHPQAMPRHMGPGDSLWPNTAESPISAYMRYLQTSMMEPSPGGYQIPHQPHLPFAGQQQSHAQSSGLLPSPSMPPLPSPRGVNGPMSHMHNLPSPRMIGHAQPMPNMPSPHMNGPGLLPSPTSQFLLPSPTAYMGLLSPRSPYPLLSPGVQFPPMTPNFAFPPMPQSGILGPAPHPPPSPGLAFPLSPSGFFPISSPRWRNQ